MSNGTPQPCDAKTKEDWIRQELRADRTLMIGLLQWGVGILAVIQLNLYYVRRDVVKYLVDNKKLQPDEMLPFFRWFLGTVFLGLLAYIFTTYMKRIVIRHVAHRKQMEVDGKSWSGIREEAPIGTLNHLHYLLFWAFPVYDLFVYVCFYAGEKLHIVFTVPW
jgi:hypothetical protein